MTLPEDLLAHLGTGASCDPGLGADLDLTAAYRTGREIHRLRLARGERAVGRKIGFTNTTIWPLYGVAAPMWAHVYDTTLGQAEGAFELSGLAEPRIEPEVVFGLGRAPEPGMDDAGLLACIDWAAPGFEIVQSVYPGWRFTLPQAAAAFGLHGALLVGERQRVDAGWRGPLASFTVDLSCDGAFVARGQASHVLGGPLRALHFLVATLAEQPDAPPLAAGEVVTTGTLTDAQPALPGRRWTTRFHGIALPDCELRLV